MFRIPALGILGEVALREAFDGDLLQLKDLLKGEIKKAAQLAGEEDWWPYIRGLFPDFFVVEAKGGKLLSYPYSVDGTTVTLGTPKEVVQTFKAVDETPEPTGAFIEAEGSTPGTFLIRVMQAGLSKNNNYYPDAVLREALPLFERLRVMVKSDEEHLRGKGKDVRNLVGQLSDARFVEGASPDTGEIQGTLTMIEPEGKVTVKLREAYKRGLSDLFGFSIDAKGPAIRKRIGGKLVSVARKLRAVKSVDLIVDPGAGGQIINFIEAHSGDDDMLRETMITQIQAKKPGLLQGKEVEDLSDDEVMAIFTEAVTPEPEPDPVPAQPTEPASDAKPQDGQDFREAMDTMEAKIHLRQALSESNLPALAQQKIKNNFQELENFREADVDAAITAETEYLAAFVESGKVTGLGNFARVEMGETRAEKTAQMLDAFFDPENNDVRSFKECYVNITGDTLVTGQIKNCDESLMREALDTSSLTNVLGDGIHRRLIDQYRMNSNLDVWKMLAEKVPVNDFRTQERTRWGGYGDLPAVAQSGEYEPLASPTDEQVSYAVSKRGGMESVTLEMIKNDDVGVIRKIPVKLARAAKRTLSKFVLDFIRTNSVIYDGNTLFHATHGNLGASALAAAPVAAGRLAMLKQKEPGSDERLNIMAKHLWVPAELEETAVDLFRRNSENDKNFVQSLALDVVPVWYWDDVDDWVLTADLMDGATVEIGFLDGQEEPEIFVQDNPLVGSMFTNDEVTYKIRHIYGGVVRDFRFAYKSVVP